MAEGYAFLDAVDRKAKWLASSARATVETNQDLGLWVLNPLARWALSAYGEQIFDDAARGYAKYCIGVTKTQQVYEKEGRYTPEAMPEVISEVYDDEGYMVPYMWAAILIYPFWPSMVNHIALYRDEFLKPLVPNARVLELASGHGILGLLAAEERKDVHVDGIDISAPAVAIAHRLLGASGHGDRVTFSVKNALEMEQGSAGKKYQGIIAAMLAEHLENPRVLFQTISHFLADDGLVFFSTALESAQRDHVYEFNRESEPLRMAEEVGLRVTRLVSDSSTPPAGTHFLPRATGMILRRR